jgi:P pilus assembly chaperone PapD
MLKRALLALALLAGGAAQAYEVKPMTFALAASGSKASTSFTVRNTMNQPIAVELGAVAHGSKADASDAFVLFPPQAMLEPGDSQMVRAQYIGGPVSEQGRYLFVVKQVPVDLSLDGQGGAVEVNVVYELPVAVRP